VGQRRSNAASHCSTTATFAEAASTRAAYVGRGGRPGPRRPRRAHQSERPFRGVRSRARCGSSRATNVTSTARVSRAHLSIEAHLAPLAPRLRLVLRQEAVACDVEALPVLRLDEAVPLLHVEPEHRPEHAVVLPRAATRARCSRTPGGRRRCVAYCFLPRSRRILAMSVATSVTLRPFRAPARQQRHTITRCPSRVAPACDAPGTSAPSRR
jgi:hypothetical protein